MSQQQDAYLAGMQALAGIDPIIDTLKGMRQKIIAQGFTEQQAGDLVVEFIRAANIHNAKKAREDQ